MTEQLFFDDFIGAYASPLPNATDFGSTYRWTRKGDGTAEYMPPYGATWGLARMDLSTSQQFGEAVIKSVSPSEYGLVACNISGTFTASSHTCYKYGLMPTGWHTIWRNEAQSIGGGVKVAEDSYGVAMALYRRITVTPQGDGALIVGSQSSDDVTYTDLVSYYDPDPLPAGKIGFATYTMFGRVDWVRQYSIPLPERIVPERPHHVWLVEPNERERQVMRIGR